MIYASSPQTKYPKNQNSITWSTNSKPMKPQTNKPSHVTVQNSTTHKPPRAPAKKAKTRKRPRRCQKHQSDDHHSNTNSPSKHRHGDVAHSDHAPQSSDGECRDAESWNIIGCGASFFPKGGPRFSSVMATAESELMTFRDKKKFFEKEIEEHKTGKKPNSERKFSYLQEHEVAKMKTEEERKKNSMSEAELSQYMNEVLVADGTDYKHIIIASIGPSSAASVNSGERKPGTSACERLLNDKNRASTNNILCNHGNRQSDTNNMTPSETGSEHLNDTPNTESDVQILEAENRAMIRKARMNSLVEDTIKAQVMIEKALESAENGVGGADSNRSSPDETSNTPSNGHS